jgi:hypothetical protein
MEKSLSTFLKQFSGVLSTSPSCSFTKFECQVIETQIFNDLNQKNKYTALDLPDNKNLILSKRNLGLVKQSFSKISSLNNFTIKSNTNTPCVSFNNTDFDLVIFEFGNLPIVKNNKNNKVLFLINYPSRRLYFLGFIKNEDIDFSNPEIVDSLNGVGQNFLLKKIDNINYFIND